MNEDLTVSEGRGSDADQRQGTATRTQDAVPGTAAQVLPIRIMSESDLQTTLKWSEMEGWNPGREDARLFRGADPEGWFMAHSDDEPVASVSAVRYGDNYGFIGMYICASMYRGRGHGLAVFNRGMVHLEGRVVGLDAVADQRKNYEKHGFLTAHRVVRFNGVLATGNTGVEGGHRHTVRELKNVGIQPVLIFDKKHFPAPREHSTRAWLTAPGHVVKVATDEEDGAVLGYGVLRPCVEGMKVAPLFATSVLVAEMLLRALATEVPPQTKVSMDVPDIHIDAMCLAERVGLSEVFEVYRMYRGTPPSFPTKCIFANTSMEIG